jgi:hypothetical protein
MLVRRSSMVGMVLCAQALSACTLADPGEFGEEIAEVREPFTASFAGTLSGRASEHSALASRGTGLLDLFTRKPGPLSTTGPIMLHRFVDGIGWTSAIEIGNPVTLPFTGAIAVTANGGRLDLFAATSDGKVYHRFSNVTTGVPTWSAWFEVPSVTVKNPTSDDAITVTSWGPGRLDLFWITPSGNIGHKWADNYVWSGTETGDDTSRWYLRPAVAEAYTPPIESVSTQLGRLDIVVGASTAFRGLKHHAYYASASGWQAPTYRACCKDGNGASFGVFDLTLAKRSGTSFSLYTKGVPAGTTTIEQLVWNNGWNFINGSIVSFDSSQPISGMTNVILNDALQWSGSRIDIVGWRGSDQPLAWRMHIQ